MAKPFVKWAGGKRHLLDKILSHRPEQFNKYIEPMVGGGALLFELSPENSVINDINAELINAYNQVKINPDAVHAGLIALDQSEASYYEIRAKDRNTEFSSMSELDRAVRTIYLNKLGYNGLYRVNRSGHFNAPFGKRSGVNFDLEEFRNASSVLQRCLILNQSFESIIEYVEENDWVYLDPPYPPISETAKFTEYTSDGFTWSEHLKIKELCVEIGRRGAKFLLSNAHTPSILELYSDFRIEVAFALRSINSDPNGRGRIPEVLVSNY